jgi:hypothetical protein
MKHLKKDTKNKKRPKGNIKGGKPLYKAEKTESSKNSGATIIIKI